MVQKPLIEHPAEDDSFTLDSLGNLINRNVIDHTYGGKYECNYISEDGTRISRYHVVYVNGLLPVVEPAEAYVYIVVGLVAFLVCLIITVCCLFCYKRRKANRKMKPTGDGRVGTSRGHGHGQDLTPHSDSSNLEKGALIDNSVLEKQVSHMVQNEMRKQQLHQNLSQVSTHPGVHPQYQTRPSNKNISFENELGFHDKNGSTKPLLSNSLFSSPASMFTPNLHNRELHGNLFSSP